MKQGFKTKLYILYVGKDSKMTINNFHWFSSVAVGHNKLHNMMKKMCEEAGIEGYKTNHSLRATAAT